MEKYVVLGNLTKDGIQNMADSPDRLETVKQMTADLGGEFIDYYMTLGEYDFVYIAELPDDTAMAKLLLEYGKTGAGKTETLRAFDETQLREIVGSLSD